MGIVVTSKDQINSLQKLLSLMDKSEQSLKTIKPLIKIIFSFYFIIYFEGVIRDQYMQI